MVTQGRLQNTYAYDAYGNLSSVTNAMGETVSYIYNELRQIVKMTDARGNSTHYMYDTLGNCIKITDALDHVTTYKYNGANEIVEVTKVGENGNVSQTICYDYDNLGNVIAITDATGNVYQMKYDLVGNLLQIQDAMGTVIANYVYDCMNQVTSVTNAADAITEYEYDSLGNLIKQVNQDTGEVTTYQYVGGQLMNAATDAISYKYDLNNNLCTVIDNNGKETSYDYDVNGRLVKTVRPNGTVETRIYDKAGQLTSILNKKGETVISEYQYSYDLSGNIISITNGAENSGDNNSKNTTLPASATMEYDQNNRLTKYNGQTVVYDKDGNMTYGPLNGKMTNFIYDCRNRLVQAGTTKYEYDAQNHRTATIQNVGTTEKTRTEFVVDSVPELSQMLQSTCHG